MHVIKFILALPLLIGLGFHSGVSAQMQDADRQVTEIGNSMKRFADYEVHYSVFNSSFIPPETASALELTRGKDRALINISVRKQLKGGLDREHQAVVTGSTSDMIHVIELDFKEVKEQGAIYYLAEFPFNDKDLRSFTIKVQPEPNIAPYQLKFTRRLYKDLD